MPATDHSIVNPKHLSTDLKVDVCRQCHLQGAVQIQRRGRELMEFRPGLPGISSPPRSSDTPTSRTPEPPSGSSSSWRRAGASRAAGNADCVSCHDPHVKPAPAETAAYFRTRCNACHEKKGCSLPMPRRQEKGDSCIACHMPARDSSNVAHAAVTDHRIMKRPDAGGARAKALSPGQFPLVPYRAGPHAPSAEERDRDLAIVLGNEFARGSPPPSMWLAVEEKMDRALTRWPGDGAAWLTRARMHAARNNGTEAVAAARRAVELQPGGELSLMPLAATALVADDFDLAIRTCDKLILMNPSCATHLLTRGGAFFWKKDWEKAETDCRAALAIQPLHANGRFMLAVCRHKRGDSAAGRRELDIVLQLTPTSQQRASLAKWYDELTR